MMTGEAEECFQPPLQEMCCTDAGPGWRRDAARKNGNLCKTQENRQADIFTKTEMFRKLIRDRHIREISKVGERGW